MGIKRKSHFKGSQEAVSEIIGTLLIVAITVILFSTVLFYVAQIPAPKSSTNVDFGTNALVITNGTAPVEITFQGGQTLYESNTKIVIIFNETNVASYLLSDDPSIGNEWTTGETWTKNLTGVTISTSVRVMVLDTASNSVVWESKMPLEVESAPSIGARGLGQSLPVIGNTTYLWAYVYDYDGIIMSVKANMSGLGQKEGNTITMIDQGGNRWESGPLTVNKNWTGASTILTAVDDQGLTASARLALKATTGSGGTSDDTGYEPRNILYSKSNGFNIFERTDWDTRKFDATPTYDFTIGEEATVVVVSKTLLNTDSKNSITVIRADNKEIVYEKSTNPFTRYRYTSGYYSYTYNLNIVNYNTNGFNNNERYIVQIRLEDNSNPTNKIFINQNITIGSGGNYPTMKFYSNAAYSILDNSYYNNELVYVEIKGAGFPASGAYYQYGGEVIIRDFVGGSQVKSSASSNPTAWNGPISGVTRIDSNTYRFMVNLTAAKLGDSWIPGKNQHYTLSFDMFTLTNGSGYDTHYLSGILNITSPVFSGGIAAGIVQGVTPAIPSYGATQGISAWVQSSSMLYYENDNTWTPPDYLEPFNQWSDYRPQGLLTTSGDVNGDGQTTEVVSYLTLCDRSANSATTNAPIYASYWVPKIVIYDRDDSGDWSYQTVRALTQSGVSDGSRNFIQVKSLAIGNIDKDDDMDVVFGMPNGSVGLCRNDGFWTYKQICNLTKTFGGTKNIIAASIVDLDPISSGHDRNRSLDIVVACSDGSIYIIKNSDGMGTFSSAPIPITTTSGSLTYLTSMCLGDMDNDLATDIVVVGGDGSGGLVAVGYNAALQGSSPKTTKVLTGLTALTMANAPKTNVTIGNYMTKDAYPDIAISICNTVYPLASTYGGIWMVTHTYASGTHTYSTPTRVITSIATDNDASTFKAKIQCMISVDIDNDGLLDLIVGTGDWGQTTTMNAWRGNILVYLNVNGNGNFVRYVVDNTGVPTRSVTVLM